MASNVLDRLRKAINKDQKELIVLYSVPGIGKTSFAAQFPKPVFVTDGKDKGVADLVRAGQIQECPWFEVSTWQDARDVLSSLADPATEIPGQTLVIENLGGFQELLCESEVKRVSTRDGITQEAALAKFNGYNRQGFNNVSPEFAAWLADIQKVLTKNGCDGKPMRVILLGHAAVVKDKNPSGELGEEFLKTDIQLHTSLQALLHKDCGCIGLMRQRPVVVKSDKGNRALSEDIREIVFHPSPNATAKNRWGLPPEAISMGKSAKEAFAFFSAAVAQAKAANQPKGDSK